jgi:fatty-acyl-CoA synthase
MRHADVAAAAVIGTPHERWGEAVSAIVVRRPGSGLTEQDVVELVKASKGPVHAPKVVQ